MATYLPIADTQKSASNETLKSIDFLRKAAVDADAAKVMTKATHDMIAAVDPSNGALVLDNVIAAVKTPGAKLEPAVIQTFRVMDALRVDMEKAASANPALATHPIVKAAVQHYKDLQQSCATLRIQERSRELADKTLALAEQLYTTIDLIPDRTSATNSKGQLRPESINKAFKDRLAKVADALARSRVMAEELNVFGAAFEVLALSSEVQALAPERWRTIQKDANLPAIYAQAWTDINVAITKLPALELEIRKASAELHKHRNDIVKEAHQVAVKVTQTKGTFAQQTTTTVQLCAEAKKYLEDTAAQEAKMYSSIEGWFYQSLRLQTPTTPIKKSVNKNHTPGVDKDPLFTSITPTGQFKKLEADHIVSMKIMTQHPDFQFLTSDDKLTILNTPSNFTGLSRRPNASKSDRTYSDWLAYLNVNMATGAVGAGTLAGETVDLAHFQHLINEETKLRPIIEAQIASLAAKNKAAIRTTHPM